LKMEHSSTRKFNKQFYKREPFIYSLLSLLTDLFGMIISI